jgi:hypothetical protein
MQEAKHYCTYFDSGYLSRGIALIQSMQKWCKPFVLWILCMDDETVDFLRRYAAPEVRLISIHEFEAANPDVAATRATRSRIEYYFTCTPALPLHILNQYPAIDMISYVDADLYFYSNPQSIYDELGSGSIAITPHRFLPRLAHFAESGIHNVGWLTFKRDTNGIACVRWWRERCIEWCYDRLENGKFADQKYLDSFGNLFDGVVSIQHKGVNVALWNLDCDQLQFERNQLWIEGVPLIFYHFHGLKHIIGPVYHSGAAYFKSQLSPLAIREIYTPYVRVVSETNQPQKDGTKRAHKKILSDSLVDDFYRNWYILKDLLRGNCIFA